MFLHTLLRPDNILIEPNISNKKELFTALVGTFGDKLKEQEIEAIISSVMEREAIMPTGLGKGVGIPHCKTDVVDRHYAALATINKNLDYEGVDGNPVRIVVLLVSPKNSNSTHIKLLSSVSRLLNDGQTRQDILKAKIASDLLETIENKELK